jgi:hypothetical protein
MFDSIVMTMPAKSLEPTPVGAFSSSFAVDITRPVWRWLALSCRLQTGALSSCLNWLKKSLLAEP